MAEEEMSRLNLGNVPFVTLNVGKPATIFYVHRDILCEASPVFKAAFLGNAHFQEANSQTADLDDDDAAAFGIITEWLYTKKCKLPQYTQDHGSEPYFMSLATVYAAAEKYGMMKLKNDLIDLLFLFKKQKPRPKPPSSRVARYVYSTTPAKSPLRKFIVVWYTWHLDMKYYGHNSTPAVLNSIPYFAADVACSLGNKAYGAPRASPLDGKSDVYHENGEGSDDGTADPGPAPEPE